MRRLSAVLLLLLLLVMAGCENYDATKVVTPVRQSITHAQERLSNAQSHARLAGEAAGQLELQLPPQTPELHSLAQRVRSEIDDLTKDLLETAESLRQSQIKVDQLEVVASKIISEREVALKQNAILQRRYGKLKFGLCALAAAGAVYLLFQFKWVLTFAGPYGWAAYVAAPLATFALFWKLIDWVL